MQIQLDQTRLKEMARTLQAAVAATPKQRFRYTQALDAIARAVGFADWNTAETKLPVATDDRTAPASTGAQPGSVPQGSQAYVLRVTHDYDTDTLICPSMDAALEQIQGVLFELGHSISEAECARLLRTEGAIDLDRTEIEVIEAPVMQGTTSGLTDNAQALLEAAEDILTNGRVNVALAPREVDALRHATDQLARDLVAAHPDRAGLLDNQLVQYPAPWSLKETAEQEDDPERLTIQDADGQVVEDLGQEPSDAALARANSLIDAIRAHHTHNRPDTPEGASDLLDAFRRAGGTRDDLFALLNSGPDLSESVDAAAAELEIDGPESAIAALVEGLGLIDAIDWLYESLRAAPRFQHIDLETLSQPAVDRLRRHGIVACADEAQLSQRLTSLVDEAASIAAAEAVHQTPDDTSETVADNVWAPATEINRQGSEGQLRFLIAQTSPRTAADMLETVLKA